MFLNYVFSNYNLKDFWQLRFSAHYRLSDTFCSNLKVSTF